MSTLIPSSRLIGPLLLMALLLFSTGGWAVVEDSNPHGDLSIACNSCHTTEGWKPLLSQLDFDHQKTKFPLVGRHASVACISCHTSLVFADAGTSCRDCHADIHRGQFAQNSCDECHTPAKWNNEEEMLVRHQRTRFPLIGVHASLDCRQCHATGQYVNVAVDCKGCHLLNYEETTSPAHATAGLPTDCEQCHSITAPKWAAVNFNHAMTSVACYACHRPDYERTTNPNHVDGQFSHNCTACHTNFSAWRPASFDHNASGFPLTGAHAAVNCAQCHVNGQYAGTPTACWDCHSQHYQSATNPNHVAGNYDHNCTVCHTTNGWSPASFDHNLSGFPLTGAHVNVNCASCHVNGQFTGTPTDCYECHAADYEGVQDPNHVAGNFNQNCTQCHTTAGWTPAIFDHSGTTFPLTGAHINASCTQCHVNGQFAGTPTDCWSCHETDYNGATEPNHAANQYPHECATCHTTTAWQPSSFDHNQTQFPLTGAHVSVNCALCHVNGQFAGTPTDCWSCHQADYDGTTDPNHAQAQFSHECLLCHTTTGWQGAVFDHSGTDFPLTGAHVSLACIQCHASGQYNGLPSDCWSCHQADYNGATDPNHAANQYPHDCATCHSTTAWEPSSFDHNQTQFPLTGAHVSVNCALCHVNGQFEGTPTDCWSCHQADYEGTTDPNHTAAGFSHDCLQCHTTTGWGGAVFDHAGTDFPLTGAHVSLACIQCHASGQYNGLPSDCWSCHDADYNGATDPNHAANQYPHDCTICHNTTAWQPSSFDHSQTQFPLTGAHVTVSCASCHVNGQFEGTPTDCWSCHQADYEETTDPNHVAAGFSHDCTLCHTTDNWDSGGFDHTGTDFPLTGAHIGLACIQCHASGQYDGLPTDCWSCHQSDYEGVTDPNHVAGQYDHTCSQCHTTTAWSPASFDHSGTNFPLTGAHLSASCVQCHVNGQFQGTPTDCYFCHQNDYNGTTNPNHVAAGFPTSCQDCHGTSNWSSNWDHDGLYFPIYSGRHAGRWSLCIECHTNPNNYAVFSCIDCHEHSDPQNMAGHHQEVPGYVFESNACYACHPTGEAGGDVMHPRHTPEQK